MKTLRTLREELSCITEKVLSIGMNPAHEPHRERFRSQIHDLIQRSYSHPSIGGYKSITSGSKEESAEIHNDITHSMIKAVHRGGNITAVRLYRDQHGRKAVASGSDGTHQGKKDFLKIGLEDHTQKRSWGEVSGAPEHIARKMGSPVIPSSQAGKLLNKPVTHIDHEYYSRDIGGVHHKKVMVGYPKLSA